MAEATITPSPQVFPEGTVLNAYALSDWPTGTVPTRGVAPPSGASVVDTATITGGVATFDGLADGTAYVAGKAVSGQWRYVRFFTSTPTAVDVAIQDAIDDAVAPLQAAATAATDAELAAEASARAAADAAEAASRAAADAAKQDAATAATDTELATHAALSGKGGHVPSGGLPATDLDFDPATQTELDAEATARAAADATLTTAVAAKQDASTAATDAELTTHAALSGKGGHVPSGGLPASDLSFDPATQAELDTHAALKTGTHGLPAMTSGNGLLWNGSTWVDTDLATQAELDTHAALSGLSGHVPSGGVTNAHVAAAAGIVGTKIADQTIGARNMTDLGRTSGGLPTGAIVQTRRRDSAASATISAITSGTLFLMGMVVLPGGRALTSITWLCGATAPNGPTNQWFCLVDLSGNVLATTLNDTTAPWTGGQIKTLLIASAVGGGSAGTYTPTNATEAYVGILVTATVAVPTLVGQTLTSVSASSLAPQMAGNSTAGLTTPASAGASVSTPSGGGASMVYAYVS